MIRRFVAAALACACAPLMARGQDFALSASPPRFELSARPGQTLRETIEIDNASDAPATYAVKTADWRLDAAGGPVFSDALAPGSCRPWVAIERHELTLGARGRWRYRFEVRVPADAGRGECRFALMIQGLDEAVRTAGGVAFPVSGRLGVIVYVDVGGAAPALAIAGAKVAEVGGEPTPVVEVTNTGDAHGRLDGFLAGIDAKGRHWDLAPSTLPVFPGETRTLPLVIDRADGATPAHIAWPITITGRLEDGGHGFAFAQRFEP